MKFLGRSDLAPEGPSATKCCLPGVPLRPSPPTGLLCPALSPGSALPTPVGFQSFPQPGLGSEPLWMESLPFPREFTPLTSFAVISTLWFSLIADRTLADLMLPHDFHSIPFLGLFAPLGLSWRWGSVTTVCMTADAALYWAGGPLLAALPTAARLLHLCLEAYGDYLSAGALSCSRLPASTFLLGAQWGSMKGLPLSLKPLPSADPKGFLLTAAQPCMPFARSTAITTDGGRTHLWLPVLQARRPCRQDSTPRDGPGCALT